MSLFSDSIKAVSVRKGTYDDIVELFSEHEEADTRLLLHASHASRTSSRIVIQLPDTDVTDVAVFFCTAHFEKLLCEELWFKMDVYDNLRFIPIHFVKNLDNHRALLYLGYVLLLVYN